MYYENDAYTRQALCATDHAKRNSPEDKKPEFHKPLPEGPTTREVGIRGVRAV